MSTDTIRRGIDPVCGMSIDPQSSAAVTVRDGDTFHFCATACREQFESNPEKFMAPREESATSCCGGGSCAM